MTDRVLEADRTEYIRERERLENRAEEIGGYAGLELRRFGYQLDRIVGLVDDPSHWSREQTDSLLSKQTDSLPSKQMDILLPEQTEGSA